MTLITLTTDFGLADSYVAVMKGVILGIAPQARIIDITHQIAPQNVRQAAICATSGRPYFPPPTIHVAVVDPGVGSARRPIAVRTAQAIFVGPDNGLFSTVLTERTPKPDDSSSGQPGLLAAHRQPHVSRPGHLLARSRAPGRRRALSNCWAHPSPIRSSSPCPSPASWITATCAARLSMSTASAT